MSHDHLENICTGCFACEVNDGGMCPRCGFCAPSEQNPSHLAQRSVLAGKYLSGRLLSENASTLTYLALEIATGSLVWMEEYFPADLARRTDELTVSAAALQDAPFACGRDLFFATAQQAVSMNSKTELAQVMDCFLENGTAYAVLKPIQATALKDAPPTQKRAVEALTAMEAVFCSVATAHERGFAHGHIDPASLLLLPNGNISLSGCFTVCPPAAQSCHAYYSASFALCAASDTNGLLIALYALLTGFFPADAIKAHNGSLPSPRALGSDINASQETVLIDALSGNHARSSGELYQALYSATRRPASNEKISEPAQVYAVSQKHPPKKPAKRRLSGGRIAVLCGALVLILAAGALIALLSGAFGSLPSEAALTPSPSQNIPLDSAAPSPSASTTASASPDAEVAASPSASPDASASPEASVSPDASASPMPIPEMPSATPVPSGTIKLADPSLFFGEEAVQTVSTDTVLFTFKSVEAYQAENYFAVLRALNYDAKPASLDHVLPFTVASGGVKFTFAMNPNGGLNMTAPEGTVFAYENVPVSAAYLDQNGITAAQYFSLAAYRRSTAVNYAGNSPSNYANGARAASQNNIIYICDTFGQTGIYALDPASGETVRISAEPKAASDLGVAGDFIYYCVYGAKSRVYRLKTDGSAAPELLMENAENLRVYGDRLFYTDTLSGALMRANLTGQNAETVLEKAGKYINIANNRLYCSNPNGKRGIYSFALNGGNEQKLSDANCNGIAVYGEMLYYISGSSAGRQVYAISTEGGEAKLLSRVSAKGISANHESVFFTGTADEALYRFDRLNGKVKTFASEGHALLTLPTTPGYLLYYTGEYDKPRLYNTETGKTARPDFS